MGAQYRAFGFVGRQPGRAKGGYTPSSNQFIPIAENLYDKKDVRKTSPHDIQQIRNYLKRPSQMPKTPITKSSELSRNRPAAPTYFEKFCQPVPRSLGKFFADQSLIHPEMAAESRKAFEAALNKRIEQNKPVEDWSEFAAPLLEPWRDLGWVPELSSKHL